MKMFKHTLHSSAILRSNGNKHIVRAFSFPIGSEVAASPGVNRVIATEEHTNLDMNGMGNGYAGENLEVKAIRCDIPCEFQIGNTCGKIGDVLSRIDPFCVVFEVPTSGYDTDTLVHVYVDVEATDKSATWKGPTN